MPQAQTQQNLLPFIFIPFFRTPDKKEQTSLWEFKAISRRSWMGLFLFYVYLHENRAGTGDFVLGHGFI